MNSRDRFRLLALVDPGFPPSWARQDGTTYTVYRGDARWFQDNIPCQVACPAHTDVSRYIALLADGRYDESLDLNWQENVFPGCLGRVCARPCEDACRRRYVDAPVNICSLKRLAADAGEMPRVPEPNLANGYRVAIVGAGPAGLAAARDLALEGYSVTVYERYAIPGGMLAVGIPEWRLPRNIVADEIERITSLGVDIQCNTEIGRDIKLSNLVDGFDAVLLAMGCQEPAKLDIPGEDLCGVTSGLTYLEGVSLGVSPGAASRSPIVIGGGYTSVDCARTALRLGASRPLLSYRRGRQDLAVTAEEIAAAEDEGVELLLNTSPTRIIGDQGQVTAVEFIRMRSGQQADGSASLAPVPGSEFIVEADQVIVAIGQRSERIDDTFWLLGDADQSGAPAIDAGFRTIHPRIWAAGDYAAGPRNLITSIADGRQSARSVDSALRGGNSRNAPRPELTQVMPAEEPPLLQSLLSRGIAEWTLTTPRRRLRGNDDYLTVPRQTIPLLPVSERGLDTSAGIITEVELGLPPALGAAEAQRCLQCQLNIFIDGSRCILCNGCVEVCPYDCIRMVPLEAIESIDGSPVSSLHPLPHSTPGAAAMILREDACVRCGRCVERCPTGCLTMDHFRP